MGKYLWLLYKLLAVHDYILLEKCSHGRKKDPAKIYTFWQGLHKLLPYISFSFPGTKEGLLKFFRKSRHVFL